MHLIYKLSIPEMGIAPSDYAKGIKPLKKALINLSGPYQGTPFYSKRT